MTLNFSSSRFGLSRVGLSVFSAMSVVILIMLGGPLSAWWSFNKIGSQLHGVNEQQIPVILKAANFAEISGSLTATAPRLLRSNSSWEQDIIWLEMDEQLKKLEASFTPPKSDNSLKSPVSIELSKLKSQIRNNLQLLNKNVSKGFEFHRLNRELSEDLRWLHYGFLDEVDPILSDSLFNIDIISKRLTSGKDLSSREEQSRLLLIELSLRDVLMKISADYNLVVGLIMRGANQRAELEIDQTLQYLREVEDRLVKNLTLLEGEDSMISIRQSVSSILEYSQGDRDLLSLRLNEIKLENENLELLNNGKDLIQKLEDITSVQLSMANMAVTQAGNESIRTLEQGRVVLLVLFFLGLVVSLIVSWYYIGVRLLSRLGQLKNDMSAIASGNFEVDIDERGNDEIAQMASALVVFRNNAIDIEDANAQTIITNAQVGLISTDDQGVIEFINPNACRLFNITDDQPTGLLFTEQFIESLDREFIDLKGLMKNGVQKTFEVVGVTIDGNRFPLDLSVHHYKRRNRSKLLLTLVDTTERKQTQQLMEKRIIERTIDLQNANVRLVSEVAERQKTEAELRSTHQELIQAAKLASLGQLSASIAHELNQPLSAIRYSTHNAKKLIEHERFVDAIKSLDFSESLADKMAKIVNHLKFFARKSDQELQSVDLFDVTYSALSLFEPRLKKVECVMNFDSEHFTENDKLLVRADANRLEQVIVNLIGNALDAVESSPKPTLTINYQLSESMLSLLVIDNGEGISDDVREVVFDPFFTTKVSGNGLGLGLSISRKIIQDFEGKLTIRSSDNNGTVMCVSLNLVAKHDK